MDIKEAVAQHQKKREHEAHCLAEQKRAHQLRLSAKLNQWLACIYDLTEPFEFVFREVDRPTSGLTNIPWYKASVKRPDGRIDLNFPVHLHGPSLMFYNSGISRQFIRTANRGGAWSVTITESTKGPKTFSDFMDALVYVETGLTPV